MLKVLIVDEMHPLILEMLATGNFKVRYEPHIAAEAISEALSQVHILVVRSKVKVNEQLLRYATKLKAVARAGAGLDNLDLDYLKSRNIEVFHAAEGNQQAVAEHTLGLILNVLNNIRQSDAEIRQHIWQREENRGVELNALTVGVIGYGYMGQRVVELLRCFGCRILVYDKYKQKVAVNGAEWVSLDILKQEADLISLHIPLTEETRGLIDTTFIDSLGKPVYFINTSRGEISPLAALCWGLKNNKLIKIGLDVLENEKLNQLTPAQIQEFSYLISNDKAVFTPHVAGWTHQSYQRISEVIARKLLKAYPL